METGMNGGVQEGMNAGVDDGVRGGVVDLAGRKAELALPEDHTHSQSHRAVWSLLSQKTAGVHRTD